MREQILMKGKKSEIRNALKNGGFVERKQENGITLIALVITIIVLLILAGVVIATLSGENGILKRAGEASDNTKRAQFIEQVKLAILQNEVLDDNDVNKKTLSGVLGVYFDPVPSDSELKEKSILLTPLTPKSEYGSWGDITVGEVLGSVTTAGGGGGKTTGSLPTTSDYGDYVTGNVVSLGISGTSGAISDNGNEWRIFHVIDGVGTFIIASDYVPVSNSTLVTAMDSSHANMNCCDNESGESPFSVNWLDLTHTMYDSNAATFLNNWTTVGYDNAKAAASLCNTTAWSGFTNNISGALAIGGPTIELYRASWNAKTYNTGTHTKLQITKRADSTPYGYYVTANNDDSTTATSTWVDLSGDVGHSDALYFPHTDVYKNCMAYWLASPSAGDEGGLMSVNVAGNTQGGIESYSTSPGYWGVRPVVFLPANISLTENNNVWTVDS